MGYMKTFVATGMSAALALSLIACSNPTLEDPAVADTVAATVNGAEIMESRVTNYIESMRNKDENFQSDEGWAAALAKASLTPETLREQVIGTFVQETVIRQAAETAGIEPDKESIDAQVLAAKTNFDSNAAWEEALGSSGFASEENYRSTLEISDLRNKLMEQETPLPTPTTEELQVQADTKAVFYEGKRSSQILFIAENEQTTEDVQAEAEEVLALLDEGTDFAELAMAYSDNPETAAKGGDAGWDSLSSFVSEYENELNVLEVGQTSGLVQTNLGIYIIRCTDEYVLPDDGTVDLNTMPEEIKQTISDELSKTLQQNNFQTYLSNLVQSAEVVINPMPSGLSYDVDMGTAAADEETVTPETEKESEEGTAGSGSVDTENEGVDDGSEDTATDGTDALDGSDAGVDEGTAAVNENG